MDRKDIKRIKPSMAVRIKLKLDLDSHSHGKNGIYFSHSYMNKYLGKEVIVLDVHDWGIDTDSGGWDIDWIECVVAPLPEQSDDINIHSMYYGE